MSINCSLSRLKQTSLMVVVMGIKMMLNVNDEYNVGNGDDDDNFLVGGVQNLVVGRESNLLTQSSSFQ